MKFTAGKGGTRYEGKKRTASAGKGGVSATGPKSSVSAGKSGVVVALNRTFPNLRKRVRGLRKATRA
jgi:hypothetical protein